MADIITNFFLTPVANRIAATQTKKLAPSLIELGADALTRNPQREAVARLFSPASSNSLIARLDSFLTAQTQQNNSATSLKNNLKSTTGLRTANDSANVQAQDIFARRETGAELRLKELLKPPAASAPPSQTPADDTPSTPAVPAITRNAGLRVDEGGSAILNSSRLRAGDADTRPQDIVFTVDDDGPRRGQLELVSKPGEAVTTFTQRDLDIGRIRYVSDGSEFTTDSFKFTVSDGTSERTGSFAISISPVNDTPSAAVNTGLTVDEGGSATITTAQLSAIDPDGISDTTVFEITTGPAYGRLEINGSAVTSFTQADLQAGRVTYVNDGSENTADSFSFRITDGSASSASGNFALTINPVDDTPEPFINTGATVEEGGAVAITTAELRLTDVDTAPEDITYTVTAGPANGRLEFTDDAGVSITRFTQADIDAGRVQFVHDGGENPTDSFNFEVADQTSILQAATFRFDVTPFDDAPVAQQAGSLAALEAGSATIGPAQLGVSDVDTASEDLIYDVTDGPANGQLEFADATGVAVTRFTQADVDSGRLRYVHDGSETTADSFSFTASDATTTLAEQSLAISITPVNDTPALVNTGATVAENGTHTVTLSELRGTDPDTASSQLVYTVTGVTNGRLESSASPGIALVAFTQDDIAAGRVRFVQDGGEAATAGFSFSLSDGNTTVGGNNFTFSVTPVNDAPFSSTNTGASVAHRSTTIISSAELGYGDPDNTPVQLTYTIASPTGRGRLELTTSPGVSITSFTQADINAGLVRYVHTANGAAADSFTFRVSDGSASTATATFNISVS